MYSFIKSGRASIAFARKATGVIMVATVILSPSLSLFFTPEKALATNGGENNTTVCHTTGQGNWNSIQVSTPGAVQGHLEHGDFVVNSNNPCPPDACDAQTSYIKQGDFVDHRVDINFGNNDRQVVTTPKSGYKLIAIGIDYTGSNANEATSSVGSGFSAITYTAPNNETIDNVSITVKKICPDVCPNVSGDQYTGPCANDTCAANGGLWQNNQCIPDACLGVNGHQLAGPCANDICTQAGGLWSGNLCVPDVCPNVVGHQTSIPCANDTCTQTGGIWQNNQCVPDSCPNVSGHQTATPCADTLCVQQDGIWENNSCTLPVDVCPSVDGMQTEGPCANDICTQSGGLWQNNQCVPDSCPNVSGHQTDTPCADTTCTTNGGLWQNNQCVPDACTSDEGHQAAGPCTADDVCPNDAGIQTSTEQCTPAPVDACPSDEGFQQSGPCTSDDVCPNDAGIQTSTNQCTPTTPTCTGNQHLVENQCVDNEVPPTCGDNQHLVENVCVNNEVTPPTPPSGGGGGGGGNGPIAGSLPSGGSFGPIGQVLGASTSTVSNPSCAAVFTSYMRKGRVNNAGQVRMLQEFLNKELGTTLPLSGTFDTATEDAVKAFQVKYASEVLSPWKPFGPIENSGTGYVYKTTLRMLNKVSCTTLNIPMPMLP
jgi:peptidoglycan hydrolase-like protein with peptidoglycan-binding domain